MPEIPRYRVNYLTADESADLRMYLAMQGQSGSEEDVRHFDKGYWLGETFGRVRIGVSRILREDIYRYNMTNRMPGDLTGIRRAGKIARCAENANIRVDLIDSRVKLSTRTKKHRMLIKYKIGGFYVFFMWNSTFLFLRKKIICFG